jgi:hypothetical protein
MPSSITVNGQVTRRPGVKGEVDTSALAGSTLDVNRVAVVAQFPMLEQGVPLRVNTPQQVKDLKPGDSTLELIAKYLWNPSKDPKVKGGPSAVFLASSTPSTQAKLLLEDASSGDSMWLKARKWGADGNKVGINIVANGTDPTLFDYTLFDGVISEPFLAIGSGDLVSFYADGTDFTGAVLAVSPLEGVAGNIGMGLEATHALGSQDVDWKVADTKPTVAADQTPTGAPDTFVVTITGINAATGEVDTDTITFVNGYTPGTPQTGTKDFSRITNMTYVENGSSTTPSFDVSAITFNMRASQFNNLGEVVEHVNGFTGWHGTVLSPKAYSTPLDEVDQTTSADIYGVGDAEPVRADLRTIISELNKSSLVTAERATNAVLPPEVLPSPANLAGGTSPAPVTADWETALDSLRTESIQILTVNNDTAAVHALVDAHCVYTAGLGASERNAWVPGVRGVTKTTLKAEIAALNSRHLSYTAQEVKVRKSDGTLSWESPFAQALICMGIQAGTPVATPGTWKVPNVLDFRQDTSWDPDQDAEELLEAGLAFFSRHPKKGIRFERSITTYVQDDHPIFSEVSANESLNTSIRGVREGLEVAIGDPGVAQTDKRIESLTRTILGKQVKDEIIKAYNPPSVLVEDLGDAWRINYEMAAIEPINFILAVATVTRTPFGG